MGRSGGGDDLAQPVWRRLSALHSHQKFKIPESFDMEATRDCLACRGVHPDHSVECRTSHNPLALTYCTRTLHGSSHDPPDQLLASVRVVVRVVVIVRVVVVVMIIMIIGVVLGGPTMVVLVIAVAMPVMITRASMGIMVVCWLCVAASLEMARQSGRQRGEDQGTPRPHEAAEQRQRALRQSQLASLANLKLLGRSYIAIRSP